MCKCNLNYDTRLIYTVQTVNWHRNETGIDDKYQKTSKTYGTQCVIQYPTNRNPAQSLQENAITNCLGCTTRCQNIWETSKVLKLKNSNLSSTSFSTPFLISQRCPTMLPHQEAIASSTSSLIWGLKEFTTMVESPTRPWSSLNSFEATPSIQVRRDESIYAFFAWQYAGDDE